MKCSHGIEQSTLRNSILDIFKMSKIDIYKKFCKTLSSIICAIEHLVGKTQKAIICIVTILFLYIFKKKYLGDFYVIIIYYKMITKKSPKKYGKKNNKYYCDICDYYTCNKKDFSKHLKTFKHKNKQNDNQKTPIVEFSCIYCDKVYKYKSGLSRHRKNCKYTNKEFVEKGEISYHLSPKEDNEKIPKKKHDEDSVMTNAILKLVESNQKLSEQNAEMMKCMKEQSKVTQELIPKVGNTTNNISINFFLNEQCKNAMNLTDFINQLQVSLEDLQYSKNNGFIEGVTNIFTKQLQDLKPTERPIHCSDKKRLQFYVKDNDTWQKDENNTKIDETIYNIKMAQTKKLTEWEKLHPDYMQDPTLSQEWGDILNSCTEGVEPVKTKEKLKRNIASKIQIKEALRDANEK